MGEVSLGRKLKPLRPGKAGYRCIHLLRGALGSSGKKKVIETRGNPYATVGLFAVSRSVTSSVRWVCWVLFRL